MRVATQGVYYIEVHQQGAGILGNVWGGQQWLCHALCLIFGMLRVSCLQIEQLPMSHCRYMLAGVGREMYCPHQMLLLMRGGGGVLFQADAAADVLVAETVCGPLYVVRDTSQPDRGSCVYDGKATAASRHPRMSILLSWKARYTYVDEFKPSMCLEALSRPDYSH